jgi:hypothetical protein
MSWDAAGLQLAWDTAANKHKEHRSHERWHQTEVSRLSAPKQLVLEEALLLAGKESLVGCNPSHSFPQLGFYCRCSMCQQSWALMLAMGTQ